MHRSPVNYFWKFAVCGGIPLSKPVICSKIVLEVMGIVIWMDQEFSILHQV